MRNFVVKCSILVTIMTAIYALRDELWAFIVIGKLPLINLSLHPAAMLLFWVLLIPFTYVVAMALDWQLWRSIEAIGRSQQKHINRRMHARRARTVELETLLASVVVATLTHSAEQTEAVTDSPQQHLAPQPT